MPSKYNQDMTARNEDIFILALQNKTLREIGDEVGVSSERVRHIMARHLRRLRGAKIHYGSLEAAWEAEQDTRAIRLASLKVID